MSIPTPVPRDKLGEQITWYGQEFQTEDEVFRSFVSWRKMISGELQERFIKERKEEFLTGIEHPPVLRVRKESAMR